MAFDSSYGEVEEGIKGATRARGAAAAEPSRAVPWRGVRVLSCLRDVRDVTHEDHTRRDVAHAW